MGKQQIDAIPLLADAQPTLPADEREVPAEFQEKPFQMLQERLLQLAFGVFVLQVKKLENHRVFHFFFGADAILRF